MGNWEAGRAAKAILSALETLVGAVVVMAGAALGIGVVVALPVMIEKAMAVSTGRQVAVLAIVATVVAAMTGIISVRRQRKRREAEELKRLQLEAERRSEEQRKLGEAKRLEAKRQAEVNRKSQVTARIQEEWTTWKRQEREQEQAEEGSGQNEKEAIRTGMPLFDSLSLKEIPSPLLSPPSNWIRETWQHEANDFTPWVAQHLELVSDCTGLKLHHLGREVAAAGGRADIVAWESKSKSKVVIENQIESADSRHFQQLVSYGETLQARIRIWIAAQFGQKYRRLVIEQNRKDELKPDGAIYYLLRIDRSVNGQPFLSLHLGPTQAQLERILFSRDDIKVRQMLIDQFRSQYLHRRPTWLSLDNHEKIMVFKIINVDEARIQVCVWCHKGWRRKQRQTVINSFANRLLAVFPEANTQEEWGYDEIQRTLLELRLSIHLENLATWDEIGEWFAHIEKKVVNAL